MSQEKITTILKEFGLSNKETEVYVFLAKHGILRGGKIAKNTRIDRSVVYRILKRLQKKGLVESTLESPTRFIAIPFEKALDTIIRKKEDEALQIRKARKGLLEDWKSISKPASESKLEKFIVVEGTKKIHQKILQMVNETTSQFQAIMSISDLVRAEQFGVFDAASNHPFKSDIQFKFITELSRDNLKAIKLLKPKLEQEIHLRVKQPNSGSTVLPRIVIKDEKEIFFFTRPSKDLPSRKQDPVCIYTNCDSLVQTFKEIFHTLWGISAEIEKSIAEIETGKYQFELPTDEKFSQKLIDVEKRVKTPVAPKFEQEETSARLAGRIRLLKEDEKDILECASVIGDEFSLQVLENISGFKRLKLLKTIVKTEKYELIKAIGEEYRFSNPATRKLIYQQIDPKLRREYHSLVAEQLEKRSKDDFEDVSEKLARHYFFSGNAEKGIPLLMKAGENIWHQRYRPDIIQDALKYYSNAIELIGKTEEYGEVKAKAFERLGEIHSILAQHDKANEFYEKGIASTNNASLKGRIRKKIRKKKIVEKDGKKLTYFVYGEGGQTIFFVGNPLQLHLPQALYFSQRFRVAVMDLVDMLIPEGIPIEHSMDFYLENIDAIVEDLKSINICFAGVILGGLLAINYITKYQGKINKLSLVATPLQGYAAKHPERKKQTDQFWAAAFQSPSWGWKRIQELTLKEHPYQNHRKTDEFKKRASAFSFGYRAIPTEIKLIYYKILSETDIRPLLRKIEIPTLILHGEKDPLSLADVKYLNKNIRGSKLKIFKDACFITLTEVEKTNEAMEEFFAD